LGWIVRGQTVPEFEAAAFRLPKGSVSDVIKTPYGLLVIKVLEQESARTQTMRKRSAPLFCPRCRARRPSRRPSSSLSSSPRKIRRAGRPSLDDLAKKFNLIVGDPAPLEAGQTIPEVGASPEIPDTVFRLRAGDVSAPIRTDRGFVVIAAKETLPAHPGTLAEVRERVMADYRAEQSTVRAKSIAEDLAAAPKLLTTCGSGQSLGSGSQDQ